eukprot:CAMPEP_0179352920 /NCGR_PEP_ID=MMETSP0797-20121207/76055_1 /TAXON_ID=47934 /ORGANISM="Dinophysis acuminata, Strain DAEP01" /LENGTH=114 /DNA_ID=CAMNT_0021067949 /DNA_START=117 /DNA_END=460 /DNA_ORIENTATION=-
MAAEVTVARGLRRFRGTAGVVAVDAEAAGVASSSMMLPAAPVKLRAALSAKLVSEHSPNSSWSLEVDVSPPWSGTRASEHAARLAQPPPAPLRKGCRGGPRWGEGTQCGSPASI